MSHHFCLHLHVYIYTHIPRLPDSFFQLNHRNLEKLCLFPTYSLSVSFVQWALLLDLGQFHVYLFADHSHGISSWKKPTQLNSMYLQEENENLKDCCTQNKKIRRVGVEVLRGKPLPWMPTSCTKVQGSSSGYPTPLSHFPPVCILGASKWWFKYLGPCHPHDRPAWSYAF